MEKKVSREPCCSASRVTMKCLADSCRSQALLSLISKQCFKRNYLGSLPTAPHHVQGASTSALLDPVSSTAHAALLGQRLVLCGRALGDLQRRLLGRDSSSWGSGMLDAHGPLVDLGKVVVLDGSSGGRSFGVNDCGGSEELSKLVGVEAGTDEGAALRKQLGQVSGSHHAGVNVADLQFALSKGALHNRYVRLGGGNRSLRKSFVQLLRVTKILDLRGLAAVCPVGWRHAGGNCHGCGVGRAAAASVGGEAVGLRREWEAAAGGAVIAGAIASWPAASSVSAC